MIDSYKEALQRGWLWVPACAAAAEQGGDEACLLLQQPANPAPSVGRLPTDDCTVKLPLSLCLPQLDSLGPVLTGPAQLVCKSYQLTPLTSQLNPPPLAAPL